MTFTNHEVTPEEDIFPILTQILAPVELWLVALVLALCGAALVFGLEWTGNKKSKSIQ